jgi:hypothetical protein
MRFPAFNTQRGRYYLLPGMGGRALRQKRTSSLIWALIVGFFLSAAFAALLCVIHNLQPVAPQ